MRDQSTTAAAPPEQAAPAVPRRGGGHTFPYLDGLRGVAALVVVFTHLALWFYPAVINGGAANAHHPVELDPLVGAYRVLSWTDVQFLHVLAGAAIVAGVVLGTGQWVLSTRPAAFLGRVSFSLYLLHSFVIATVGRRFFVALHDAGVGYGLAFAATCALCVPLCLGVAYAFTRAVDEPGLRLSRRWADAVRR